MRKMGVAGLVLLTVLVFCNSLTMAFWKQKVTRNQVNTRAYLEQLMNGADPDSLERPHLRFDPKFQARRANREMREAMDQAEELARQGEHDQIIIPEFRVFLSEDRFNELEEDLRELRGRND